MTGERDHLVIFGYSPKDPSDRRGSPRVEVDENIVDNKWQGDGLFRERGREAQPQTEVELLSGPSGEVARIHPLAAGRDRNDVSSGTVVFFVDDEMAVAPIGYL